MIEFDTLNFSDGSEIYTIYTGSSIPEFIRGIPIIHIEFAASLPYQISNLIVHNRDEATEVFAREVLFDSTAHRGFAISVPSIGNYSFASLSNDSLLCHALSLDSVATFAALIEADTFYKDVGIGEEEVICHPPTPTPLPTVAKTLHPTGSVSPMPTGL
jgi:hypothetical protein